MSWVTSTIVVEAALNREQVLLRLGADDRVERAEGLVHQQHRRLGRERARHADPLLLAAGELVRECAARSRRVELEQVEQLVHARRDARRSQPSSFGTVRDVLRHRAVREEAMALDHVADAPPQFMAGTPAVSCHRSARGRRSARPAG